MVKTGNLCVNVDERNASKDKKQTNVMAKWLIYQRISLV